MTKSQTNKATNYHLCEECRRNVATSTVIRQGKRRRRCGTCLRKLNWSKKTGNPD